MTFVLQMLFCLQNGGNAAKNICKLKDLLNESLRFIYLNLTKIKWKAREITLSANSNFSVSYL